ncbi:uncharacterized protein [Palaemon carinicauda]|uniref:uncharacterized protein n=1 Tax=Palaemon carinicauda TaxID=392227 RepID=UPI0035B663A6
MIVYAPATSMNVSYHKTTPSTVNITCDTHGMYPKSLLKLYEGATKQPRSLVKEAHEEVIEAEGGFSDYLQAQMEDGVLKQQETIFECVLSIPETEYQVRRNIIYFPGYDAFEALAEWIEDWVTNRKQRVAINKEASEWTAVTSGVHYYF